jgi:hypothetical protein
VSALLVASSVFGEAVGVPVTLQADLLVRAAAYDRNMRGRGGDLLLVVLVVRSGRGDSERAAAQMQASLASVPTIAGRKHREERFAFKTAGDLASFCRSRLPGILYLAPDLGEEVTAIAGALAGADVLSVSGAADYVPRGVVLGFDLQSGRPKLLVNLGQALRQNVSFEPTFLRLAKVVDR